MIDPKDAAPRFVQAGNDLIAVSSICHVDISQIENQRIVIHTSDAHYVSEGFHAIEALMVIRPSAMEGRRLRWSRNAFAFHNLCVHPILQILVWIGLKRKAIEFHDRFTPKPEGFKRTK